MRNRTQSALFILVLAAALAPHRVTALPQAACPGEDPKARKQVEGLLTEPDLGSFRSEYGISAVSPATLRPLTDAADASACAWLNANVDFGEYGRPVYYTAGGFYFATAVKDVPPGQVYFRAAPVAVLDAAFNVRGVIGI